MPQRDLILRMKEERRRQGKTYLDIEAETERMGTPVSGTSIKRVFAEGSEEKDFRNETTLMPIARTLLTPEEIRNLTKANYEDPVTNLKAIISLKEEMIDVLNREIDKMDQDNQKKNAYFKKELKRLRIILWCLSAFSVLSLATAVIALL